MKSVFELQQIYLQAREKQDELFKRDLKYFIGNIEKQIEENAEKGIDTTKLYIAYGECDIGEGYIKHTRFKEVTKKIKEHFEQAGFEIYIFESILEIKLPPCKMIRGHEFIL
jgi:hypothetical protein